jgi:predicted Zn-dependent protease
MLDKNKAAALIERIGSYTKHYATVTILDSQNDVTRFANSEISQNISISDTQVSVTLYDGKKEATNTGNVLTGDGLLELTAGAEAILALAPEGEFEAFPPSDGAVKEATNDGKLAEAFDAAKRARMVKEGVMSVESGYSAAGALSLNRSAFAFGDNRGVIRFADFDSVRFNAVVTHGSGAAGGDALISYTPGNADVALSFEKARGRASRALNPVPVGLGAYTVVLSPAAFGDLIAFVAWMLNAKMAEDGVSFAAGKLGERVFGENITFRDDVNHPGTQPFFFDMEGNGRQPLDLVENGVLKNLLHDNKTAARSGVKPTGHALSNKGQGGYPMNLVMEGGEKSLEEIIAETQKGIFVNEFHYTNFVNPRALQITGLTRNGAFIIEDGRLTKPVTTMRFTQNLIEGLNQVTALSKERAMVDVFETMFIVPAVRMEGFHFTGQQ